MNFSHIDPHFKGTLLVALSAILYGTLGYFGVMLLRENFSVSTMLFWRFLTAALWILCFSLICKKKIFNTHQRLTTIMKILMLWILTYCGASTAYFFACERIGTGVAMVIFFSYPIFVTLSTWLMQTSKINKHTLFALTTVIIGLICLQGNGAQTVDAVGLMWAFVAAFCYGIYVFANQNSAKILDSRMQTFLVCLGNATLFFLFSVQDHSLSMPASVHAWSYVLAFGIIATALPIQLLLDGLSYVSPIQASILSVLEPIITLMVGILLLSEKVSFIQLIGIGIILLGAIAIQFEKRLSPQLAQEEQYET